jgi:hypothetical protein
MPSPNAGLRGWRRSAGRAGLQVDSLQTGNFTGKYAVLELAETVPAPETAAPQRLFEYSLSGLTGKIARGTGKVLHVIRELKPTIGQLQRHLGSLRPPKKRDTWLIWICFVWLALLATATQSLALFGIEAASVEASCRPRSDSDNPSGFTRGPLGAMIGHAPAAPAGGLRFQARDKCSLSYFRSGTESSLKGLVV